MKQTPLKQIGKIGRRNIKANFLMKKICIEKGIRTCEVCSVLRELGELVNPCFVDSFLSYAHRSKRVAYRSNPEMLSSYNQFVLACQNGHDTIEYNGELTKKVFQILRGKDEL